MINGTFTNDNFKNIGENLCHLCSIFFTNVKLIIAEKSLMKLGLIIAVAMTLWLQIPFAYSQSTAEVQTRLDEYMNRLSSLGFSGALLVAKEGEIIFSKGYGMADRARQIPVTTETVFTTGSITKQFTAAAILKLEMQGKLSVHDPITMYFKNIPQDKTSITLHHLLTHTAGFKPALGYDFAEINREEFVQLALNSSLNHAPGEEYEYSNVGFSLLAAIVEQVSGQSYDAFLQEYLFKPAGMSKTGYVAPNWKRDEMAHGYKDDKDWGTFLDHPRADNGPFWHLRGNGGILSTVGDMYWWHLALEGNNVLSEEAKRKLYTPYVREGKGAVSFYGYGWSIVTTRRGTRLITHNGGNPYFSADFLRYVDEDVIIYMVANTAEQRATRHSRQIARIVFGYDYILPPTIIETIPETELQNTAMGQHAQAFLEMLSSRDEQHTRRLIEQHFAPELLNRDSMATHLRTLKSDQEEIGAVKYGQGVKAGENAIELTVQSKRSGEWWLLTLEFEPLPPHRIVGIGVTDSEPPAETKTTTTEDEEQNNFAEKWELPNSATGRRAAAFLETIERSDEVFTRQFIAEQFAPSFLNAFSMDEHLQRFKQRQHDMVEIELLDAQKTGPYSAELTLRARKTGQRFEVKFKLEPATPHRFVDLSVKMIDQ